MLGLKKQRLRKHWKAYSKARGIVLSWFRARQSSVSNLGLCTAVLTVLLIGTTLLFVGVTTVVMSGEWLVETDRRMMLWFEARQSPLLTSLLSLVSDTHATLAISAMGTLLGLYLLWRGERRSLLTLALVLPGGMLTNVLLKHVFQRDRPTLKGRLLTRIRN